MRYSKMLDFVTKILNDKSETPIDVCLNATMAREIEAWRDVYEDKASWLNAKQGIKSAGLAGSISAELARLVTIELRSEVTGNDFINSVYKAVLDDIRVQTEYACAGGGLVFKPYPTNEGVNVQFIRSDCFFPVFFDAAGNLTVSVFVDQFRAGKKIYTRLEIHSLDASTLQVQNYAFVSQNKEFLGNEIQLIDVPQWAKLEPVGVFNGVKKPLFGYFKIPLANTVDPDCPIGVSVFSRALGLIAEADRRYSNECWEFEATQAAVHIAESLLKRDKDSSKVVAPGGKERLYRQVEYSTGATDKPLIDPFLPEIRFEAIQKGYQDQLKRIEFVCGLAYGTLSDPQVVDKTAEEIRFSKQRSYATVTDIQTALGKALTDLVDAIAFWVKKSGLGTEEPKLSIEWGDSILTDPEKTAARAMLERMNGITDDVKYFTDVYGLKEEAAKTLVADIAARKTAMSEPPDVFGGGA